MSSAQFPTTWTADDYAWKTPLPGKGHSSPVGWGSRLFVTSGSPHTGELALLSVDAANGEILWSRHFASRTYEMHDANSYASSTPAVDGQRVYLTWATPQSLQAAAVTHDGTQVVWQRDLGPVDYKHGFGGSPIVVDGAVIICNDHSADGFVIAVDAETGEPRWRRDRPAGVESYATPTVLAGPAGQAEVIVDSTAEGMTALSAADGHVAWQVPRLFTARCVTSPIIAGGLVIAGSGEGGSGKSFAAVRPSSEPSIVYEFEKSIPQVPTPVAADGLLFIWSDQGVVTCCDVASGKQHWTKRVGGRYFSSPIIAGNKLYGTSASGEVVVLAAAKDYQLLGRNELGEASHATPAVQEGKLYFRTESSLLCLPSE